MALGSRPTMAQTSTDETAEYVRQAREAQSRGDADASFTFIDKAYEARCFAKPFNADAWAEVVTLKAMAYGMKYDWDKAIKIGTDAFIMLQSTPHSTQFAETLYDLATFYAGRGGQGDFEKAIGLATTAKEYFNKRSRSYFACGNDLAYYYMFIGRPTEAQEMAKNAIKSGEVVFSNDLPGLAKELWSKAEDFSELEEYEMAETYALSTIGLMVKSGDTLTTDYVHRLVKIAGYFFQQRDFNNEIVYLETAAPVAQKVRGPESKEYVDILRKLALAYNHKANDIRDQRKLKDIYDASLKESERYEDLAREILIKTNRLDEIRVPQLPLISNSALKFYNAGEIEKAIKYELIAAELCEKYNERIFLANSYSHLSTFYDKTKEPDKSLEYGEKSVAIYDQEDSINVFKQMTYNNYSIYLHNAGKDQEALKYGLKSAACLEQLGDTISDLYAKTLNNLSIYYDALGMKKESIDYAARASSVRVASVESENAAILASINSKKKKKNKAAEPIKLKTVVIDRNMVIQEWNRAVYADNNNDVVALHEAYGNAIRMQRQLFIEKYSNVVENATVDLRRAEWNAQKPIFDFASTLAYSYALSPELVKEAWNAMLMADGMDKFIQTGDTTFISKNLKTLQEELSAETAVVRFFTTETDKGIGHSALVIRKDWEQPRAIVPLFTEKEIFPISFSDGSTVPDLLPTPEGRRRVMTEPRVGSFILEPVISALGDLSTISEVRYHPEGMLLDLDPAEFFIDENKPVRSLFRMTKE